MISGGGGSGGSGEAPFLIFRVVALQSSGSCLKKKHLHHGPADCSASKTTSSSTRAMMASNQVDMHSDSEPGLLNSCTSVLSRLQSKAFPVGLSIKKPIDALLVAEAR